MISLGMTTEEYDHFNRLLRTNHHVRIVLHVMDMDHNRLSNISSSLIDGQVSIDFDSDVTRSMSLTLLDPQRALSFDTYNPDNGAVFIDRMIQAYYVIAPPSQDYWIPVPVFCGPITKLERSEELVSIDCQGKEVLALDPVYAAKTYTKGATKVSVIRNLLEDVGETKFSFATSDAKIATDFAVSSENKPWSVAREIANSMSMQLFYDGRGVCVMRPYTSKPIYTFRSGVDSNILSKPQIGYDMDSFSNVIIVKGVVPKGKTKPVSYRAEAPAGHPFSPVNLGRNGKPRYAITEINDDTVTTEAEAQSLAKEMLNEAIKQSINASFEALPTPHLEPRDPYRLITDEYVTDSYYKQGVIPFGVSSTSSVGYIKSTHVKPRPAAPAVAPSPTGVRRPFTSTRNIKAFYGSSR